MAADCDVPGCRMAAAVELPAKFGTLALCALDAVALVEWSDTHRLTLVNQGAAVAVERYADREEFLRRTG